MSFTRFGENRFLRLSQRKRDVQFAPEPVRAECLDDFTSGSVLASDLDGGVAFPKTDSPAPRVGFRMQITDKDVSVEARNARELARHATQIRDMSHRK